MSTKKANTIPPGKQQQDEQKKTQERQAKLVQLRARYAEEELNLRISTSTREELDRMEKQLNEQLEKVTKAIKDKLAKIATMRKKL